MSTTVRSYGLIAVLKNPPVGEEEREALEDELYAEASDLGFNNAGDLLVLDYNRRADYREREDIYIFTIDGKSMKGGAPVDPQDIVKEAAEYGFEIDEASIKPFDCIWYNGVDCPVDMMTKEEFLARP